MDNLKVERTSDFGKYTNPYNISIHPNDKYFICGGEGDTDIHVWEVKTLKEINTIEGMTCACEPYFFDLGRKVYCHSVLE